MSQQGRRDFFLKGYAAIYCIAFSSLYVQYRGLYGSDGLEPVEVFLKSKQKRLDATTPNELFWKYPTLAWYHVYLRDVPVDLFMELLCLLGIVLSSHAFLTRCGRSMMCFGSLWLLYLSLYQVGQTFLSFQWDLLLLEAGFLAIWLASPLPTENNEHFEPPQAIVWCLRFLLFKLMAMAGTVKFQSACPTWLNLTALDFHYATQCLPTPVAWLYHQFPPLIQKFSVASTFLIELPATVLLLFPSHSVRKVSVSLQVLLQLLIMFTGNYTYFNLLTLLLCFATLDPTEPCNTTVSKILSLTSIVFLGYSWYFMFEFDQGTLRFRLPAAEFASYFAPAMRICIGLASSSLAFSSIKQISHWIVRLFKSSRKLVGFATLVYLLMGTIVGVAVFSLSLLTFTTLEQSVQGQVPSQVYSLYQKTQIWHIAHPYGLFRRMTGVGEVDVVQSDGTRRKVSNVARPEIILEGTDDNGTTWKPYHFNYKPGEVTARPLFVAPHQPRLDWQMWFAALGTYQHNPWLIHLVDKLLENSADAKGLLDFKKDPFPFKPPTMIRARLFHYDFTRYNTSWARSLPQVEILSHSNVWWTRRFVQEYIPPLNRNNPSVATFLEHHGWKKEKRSEICASKLCFYLRSFHATPKRPNVVVAAVIITVAIFNGICTVLNRGCCKSKRSQHLKRD